MKTKLFNRLKKYNKIVIARHIGPDPDALGSQMGLKELINKNFPDKEVYVVGAPTIKFKYFGKLDKLPENFDCSQALLILLDTPDKKRIDGVDTKLFKDSIRIDHHPFMEKTCRVDLIDDKASSTCQIIVELFKGNKYTFTKKAAEYLFLGMVADTNRFLYTNGVTNSIKLFELVSYLIKLTKIDISTLYTKLYMRNINEIKLQGYISQNLTITENGVGYIKITEDIIKEFNVDSASAGNMVNEFNFIDGILVWIMISEDKKLGLIRLNIRSRGPVINKLAENYNGGGHKLAAGARVKTEQEVDQLIEELDNLCQEYREEGVSEDEDK
ncbi:MAG: bifunctional oligoribonuclease/PAP phosphatase NrnA [Mollicutes bacterium]|nr:bifunctional oligoribonuclease/PAP phosphatase NrnA [Mollicutes bacterium]